MYKQNFFAEISCTDVQHVLFAKYKNFKFVALHILVCVYGKKVFNLFKSSVSAAPFNWEVIYTLYFKV